MSNKFIPVILLLITLILIVALLALPLYLRYILDFTISILIIILILIPASLFFLYKTIKEFKVIDFIKPLIFIILIIIIPILVSKSIKIIERFAAIQYYNDNKFELINLVKYAEINQINYAIKKEVEYTLYRGFQQDRSIIENDEFVAMLNEMKIHAFGREKEVTYLNLYKAGFPCFGLGFVKINTLHKWRSHIGTSCTISEIYSVDENWSYYYYLD